MARPTKYNKEMLKKAEEYLVSCVDTYNPATKKVEVNFPTGEGLALHLEVSRSTLYEWSDKHDEFSDILEAINQQQVKRLIEKGLSGDYNSTIAKLVLAKHGYSEKQEIEHKGDVNINVIDYDSPQV